MVLEGGQGVGKCCNIILIKNIIPPHKNKTKLHQTVATLEHGIWIAYICAPGPWSLILGSRVNSPFPSEVRIEVSEDSKEA